MVNSRDIARIAGVSQSTVSRVLQSRPEVSAASRAKVEAALRSVGFTPNPHAQAMRKAPTNNIGVVVGRITNPFYPELLTAVNKVLHARGKRMTLWTSDDGGDEAAVHAIRDRIVDGLIFTTARYQSVVLREALEQKAPIVLLNRSLDDVDCDQLTSDNTRGSALAARYLVENGHTRIAILGGMPEVSTSRERRTGFLDAVSKLGHPVPPEFDLTTDFTHEAGAESARRLLSLDEPPTAIFCVNDLIAFGVLDAARSIGVRVPEQLSVIGYDDIEMSSWPAYDLTTIRQPTTVMAEFAVEMLLERLADRDRPFESRRYSAELVLRGSAGPRAASTDS